MIKKSTHHLVSCKKIALQESMDGIAFNADLSLSKIEMFEQNFEKYFQMGIIPLRQQKWRF